MLRLRYMKSTIWSLEAARRKHKHSPRIADQLSHVLPMNEPVLDLGCGAGFYLDDLSRKGYQCRGVEGTPSIQEIALFGDIVEADLSLPLALDWPRSSVICLEVAEHLHQEFEAILIDSIDRYCAQWLVISWAIPGQSGYGHYNCRPNSYVHRLFEDRGFALQGGPTFALREAAEHHVRYFRNTLLVFRRQ